MMKRGRGRPRKKINIRSSPNPYSNSSNGEVPRSDILPEFFKMYTPALSSTLMRIPPNFIDKFGGSIPTACTLKMPSLGSSWEVSINRVNDDWFFQGGWSEFVGENSLQDRDFLIFCYVGESRFLVKIFSPNGCPKVAIHTSRVDETSDSESDSESESEKYEIVRTKRRIKNDRRWGDAVSIRDGKPCFEIKVMEGYMKRGAMRVPMKFWDLHMENKKKSRMATLWVENDSSIWDVELAISQERVLFQKGILEFMKENSIKVGASCTFQLIDDHDFNTSFSFKVTFD